MTPPNEKPPVTHRIAERPVEYVPDETWVWDNTLGWMGLVYATKGAPGETHWCHSKTVPTHDPRLPTVYTSKISDIVAAIKQPAPPQPAQEPWMREAAEEIDREADYGGSLTSENAVKELAAIILKHAPHAPAPVPVGDAAVPVEVASEIVVLRSNLTSARAELYDAHNEYSNLNAAYQQLAEEYKKDSWTAEMQEALGSIPTEFVQSDYWVNGIKRMAAALTFERAQSAAIRDAVHALKDIVDGKRHDPDVVAAIINGALKLNTP